MNHRTVRTTLIASSLIAASLVSNTAHASLATVISFAPIAYTTLQNYASYSEGGFNFTTTTGFASWGSADSNYNGSQALFNNYDNHSTTLTKAGGGAFSFDSIDLSEVYNLGSYSPTSVVFNAALSGGGTATYTANLDLVFGNQTFNFGGLFSNITSVSWAQTYNYHQFDNLVINSVPEPEAWGMLLAGLGLIGWRARQRG